jgi:hypothetical protein
MSFKTEVELEGGLRLKNTYAPRDLLYYIKKHKSRRRSTPVLPWLMDLAFEDKENHFPDKSIQKMIVIKSLMD